MIAVDTNLLVYAHREDSSWYRPASAVIKELAQSRAAWAIPWPCIHEFLAIVTHPRVYRPPIPIARALAQIDAWFESPTLQLLSERPGLWQGFRSLIAHRDEYRVLSFMRVAALCAEHGVRELWTTDRDFSRFGGLRVRNPLIE